jgi:hypothetical protein
MGRRFARGGGRPPHRGMAGIARDAPPPRLVRRGVPPQPRRRRSRARGQLESRGGGIRRTDVGIRCPWLRDRGPLCTLRGAPVPRGRAPRWPTRLGRGVRVRRRSAVGTPARHGGAALGCWLARGRDLGIGARLRRYGRPPGGRRRARARTGRDGTRCRVGGGCPRRRARGGPAGHARDCRGLAAQRPLPRRTGRVGDRGRRRGRRSTRTADPASADRAGNRAPRVARSGIRCCRAGRRSLRRGVAIRRCTCRGGPAVRTPVGGVFGGRAGADPDRGQRRCADDRAEPGHPSGAGDPRTADARGPVRTGTAQVEDRPGRAARARAGLPRRHG